MPESVFLAIPSRGSISAGLLRATVQIGAGVSLYDVRAKGNSLLAWSFNALWCEALNEREKFRWFVMCHDDIVLADGWLQTMITEKEKSGADILQVVAPLRDPHGLTSTGLMDLDTHETRRLSLAEIAKLPETFTAAAADALLGGGRESLLLINSGLWICDMQAPWVESLHFEMRDRIARKPDGTFIPQCVSEDWLWSIVAYRLGLKLVASWKIKITHGVGELAFPNHGHWGDWDKDEDGPGQPFGIDDILQPGERVPLGFRPPAASANRRANTTQGKNLMELYELLGRTTHDLKTLQVEYNNLLDLVARVKAGQIDIERVVVSMPSQSWTLLPEPPAVAVETSNGDAAIN